MTRGLRVWLAVEAGAFALAALVHAGILATGYEHREARIAETVIAVVLLAGLAATWLWPARARLAAIAAQGFALLGTLIGIVTIIAGPGPRTVPDIVYHPVMVALLALGLTWAMRRRTPGGGTAAGATPPATARPIPPGRR